MSNAKHTPGPWITFEQGDSTAMIVATEAKDHYGRRAEHLVRVPLDPSGTAAANARLFASAPDAARILRHLLEWVDAGEPTMHFDGLMPDDGYGGAAGEQTLADAVRAYFAKSKGRT